MHPEIRQAVNDFNNLPYRSPNFGNETTPCDLCLHYSSGSDSNCGEETDNGIDPPQPGRISHADVTLYPNNGAIWIVDSADLGIEGSGWYCVLRNTIRHEIIHAAGEGHSAVKADLMYPSSQVPENYDADAQNGLSTMYGPLPSGTGRCAAALFVIEVHC